MQYDFKYLIKEYIPVHLEDRLFPSIEFHMEFII